MRTAEPEVQSDDAQEETAPFQLTALDFRHPPGAITLVCGPTGCGKSSLLSAILGEMELLEGTVTLPKRPLRLLRVVSPTALRQHGSRP